MSLAVPFTGPPVGLRHEEHLLVAPIHTVPEIDDSWLGFRDMPPVLATAMMIAFIEQTCAQAVRPFLEPGQRTVGTEVQVDHRAATCVGMTVTARIELVAIERRSLLFNVECYDEAGLIGKGTHRRATIEAAAFIDRAIQRRDQVLT